MGAHYGWPYREGTFLFDVDANRELVYPLPKDDQGYTYPVQPNMTMMKGVRFQVVMFMVELKSHRWQGSTFLVIFLVALCSIRR